MKRKRDITDSLNRSYFWDVNLIPGKPVSKKLIIERVFHLGSLDEMHLLLGYYGKDEIFNVLSKLNYIDPKTFNFIAKYFRKPKKEFKCYLKKQLMLQY